ncbi:MAG: 1-acyl-sn-glycerol-3-phosphate acyltransferase [Phycisphaerae bacterium]|nr:1-acyl-sn-glycerol-3-phosphate acyltransferase [Phycisphaerae bacterium]
MTDTYATESTKPLYGTLRFLCWTAFKTYFRGRAFHVNRVPMTGPALLVANHQSFLDPIVGALSLPRECSYLARETLFRNRFFGGLIRRLNAFPVKRGAADVNAVKEVLRRLRDGKLVMIFPEGTRSRDGAISRFNPNSLLIAQRAKVPIVPVLIDGAYQAFPRGRFIPRPYRIHVIYAEPLTVEESSTWPIDRIVDVVMQRLEAGMEESRHLRQGRLGPNRTHAK